MIYFLPYICLLSQTYLLILIRAERTEKSAERNLVSKWPKNLRAWTELEQTAIKKFRAPLPVIIFCSPMPVTILLRQMRSKAPEVTGCTLQPSHEWPGLTKHLYFKKYLEFLQINLFFSFWSCSQFENRSRTNQTITKSNEHVPNPDWFALPCLLHFQWNCLRLCNISNDIYTDTRFPLPKVSCPLWLLFSCVFMNRSVRRSCLPQHIDS